MCGIAGFIGMHNDALLKKMTRVISHRGPDDEGIYGEGNVGLGHRRLSIIDLSRHGHQPMIDYKKRAVISYNGEIYNYQEIKKELIDKGYCFNSQTDTEVVLNAYLEWGEACLLRFNGMFAFALWDRVEKELFLARDRLGIKPLFYTQKDNVFLFGSEIKSLLCWDKIPREVNARALDYYFTFRYNHLDESLFKNVWKLPPGYYMKVSQGDSNGRLSVEKHQYWNISGGSLLSDKSSIENELAEKIENAVKYRMVSDVPLGVFLSSGVDSNTIVGIMKKGLGIEAKTFTVGFDYAGFEDELKPVRFSTKHYETEHTEYICKPDMVSILPQIVGNADELNADPALIPTYLISEIAGKKVKVVLSGEGSDELFGGYERTMFMKYAWNIDRYLPPLMKLLPKFISIMPPALLDNLFKYTSSIGEEGVKRLSSFCKNIKHIGKSYVDVSCMFNHHEKRRLYGPKLQRQLHEEDIAESIDKQFFGLKMNDSEELFYRLAYFELKTRLPNDLLSKVDSMTMAHSLEGRVPFLDHSFVEYAFAIPSKWKIRYMREKYILRKAAQRYLPKEIVKRRKDHFFVPIHLWLNNELKEVVEKILTPENVNNTGYLNYEYIRYAYDNYRKGHLFFARQLWNILLFLIWHKLFIESDIFLRLKDDPIHLDELFN